MTTQTLNSEEAVIIPSTYYAFIINAVKPQFIWFLFMAILPSCWVLEQVAFPYCTKLLIDAVTQYSGNRAAIYSQISNILYFGAGVWIFLVINWRFLDIVDVYFIPKLQADIRMQMFSYLARHSHQYFADEFAGSLANKISDMANGTWDVLVFIFRDFMPVSVSIFVTIIVLATINPLFSLIFILFYFAHISICYYLSKNIENLSDIHSEDKSALQGKIVDSLGNITNVRLFSNNSYELSYLKRFQQIEISSHKKLLWSLFHVRVITEIPSFLMMASSIYLLIHGWQQGYITPGDFALIISLSFNVMTGVWRLGWMLPNFFKQVGTCQQALSIIRKPHQIVDEKNAQDLKVSHGKIEFENVHFHYNANIDLFKNKNIIINPGEKVGLVGFSGSGKSTFVNLILRYYDVESGKILIDSQNIAEVTQDSLRKNIAMIPQDVTLFHRSLKENIKYGNFNATESEIIEASKKSHCHDFIKQLKKGYDTLVGERGIKLSGGQRQRIAIARAILKNAPILILDEATSALDSVTEKVIQKSLNELMEGRTTIIIAHRLSTLLGMDKILVFSNGEIIEQGSHQELLSLKGHYAMLWAMQIGGFIPEQLPDEF